MELVFRVYPAPRKGAPVMLRCHVDISVARLIVAGVQVMQISRPGSTHDSCRCLLTPNLREVTSDPLILLALDRVPPTASSCVLWGQVGLTSSQTRFVGGLVGAARVTSCCAEATDALYVDYVSAPSATTPYRVFVMIRGGRAVRLTHVG